MSRRSRRLKSSVVVAVIVIAASLLGACGDSEDGAGGTAGTARETVTSAAESPDPGGAAASSIPPAAGSGPADAELTVVLERAVEEERRAEATYRNVVAALGEILPFTNIADSEAQHVAALLQLTARYGVDVSAIQPDGVPSPATKRAACEMGVAAELADIALYDELLPQVTAYPDVTQVLENLRTASQDNHLPAFQRCA